jgi:hypothetical protein
MNVYIRQIQDRWVLSIESDVQVLYAYTDFKLIDVLGVACLLKLHVTNADELPLNQYLKVG